MSKNFPLEFKIKKLFKFLNTNPDLITDNFVGDFVKLLEKYPLRKDLFEKEFEEIFPETPPKSPDKLIKRYLSIAGYYGMKPEILQGKMREMGLYFSEELFEEYRLKWEKSFPHLAGKKPPP